MKKMIIGLLVVCFVGGIVAPVFSIDQEKYQKMYQLMKQIQQEKAKKSQKVMEDLKKYGFPKGTTTTAPTTTTTTTTLPKEETTTTTAPTTTTTTTTILPVSEIKFTFPSSIDINSNNDIFVYDNYGVTKFSNANGQVLFDKIISGNCRGFTIDGEDNILVFDISSAGINKYNKDGEFVEKFMTKEQLPSETQQMNQLSKMAFNKSSGDFCFSNEKGQVYIFNKDKQLVNTLSFVPPMEGLLFDNNGSLYVTWANAELYISKYASPLSDKWTSNYFKTGLYNKGLGIDKNGFIYCAFSNKVIKFDQQGNQLAVLGENQFSDGNDVAVDSGGTIYVIGKKDNQYKLIIVNP